MALYYVPYAYLTVAAALRNMDPAMEEASYLNGSGVIGTALRVTLPVVRPSLISALFFIFVLACGTFAIPAVLDRASQVRFLAVDIFQASATYPIDYGTSAAIGTLLFWISVMGVAAYRFASRAARRFVTVTARGYRIRLVRLRGWRWPAVGAGRALCPALDRAALSGAALCDLRAARTAHLLAGTQCTLSALQVLRAQRGRGRHLEHARGRV